MKVIAIFTALLVSGPPGVTSGAGDVPQEGLRASERLGAEASKSTDVDDIEAPQTLVDSTASVPMGDMSEEEKERRKQVCERRYEACRDWCNKRGPTLL